MPQRRMLIAGNWKMHNTVSQSLELVGELRRLLSQVRDCDIVVAPPYTALWPVGRKLEDSTISLGAQEIFYESHGAFTGAISGAMLHDVGCTYVLVGHSERRQLFAETLESSQKRLLAALDAGLVPILCVGESLAERQSERTHEVVGAQLAAAIAGIAVEKLERLVVAYEPVWAIGTGQVASALQAQDVHSMIRERLRAIHPSWAERVRILYGGSVKSSNAAELLSQKDIDGALVGGASLDAKDFAGIVQARPR